MDATPWALDELSRARAQSHLLARSASQHAHPDASAARGPVGETGVRDKAWLMNSWVRHGCTISKGSPVIGCSPGVGRPCCSDARTALSQSPTATQVAVTLPQASARGRMANALTLPPCCAPVPRACVLLESGSRPGASLESS